MWTDIACARSPKVFNPVLRTGMAVRMRKHNHSEHDRDNHHRTSAPTAHLRPEVNPQEPPAYRTPGGQR